METKTTEEKELTEHVIDLLVENKDSPIANKVANMAGLQVVDRNGKIYVRRIPKRLTGKALDSAIAFGDINHNNRNTSGVVILPNGNLQNKTAFISAREMKGTKFVKEKTEKEKIKDLIDRE